MVSIEKVVTVPYIAAEGPQYCFRDYHRHHMESIEPGGIRIGLWQFRLA
jgi:hypothetical protein